MDSPRRPLSIHDAVLAVVRHLLAPLVRLLLAHGVKFQQVSELLKSVYVEEAARASGRERRNISLISVSTGIHRKDVNRLLDNDGLVLPRGPLLEAELFTRWVGDPRLAGADGQPIPLPRNPSPDGSPSFDSLARSVTTDVHPRALLEEMLRLDLVELLPDDRVRLQGNAFVPRPEREQMLRLLADNVHDHLATAVANVCGRDEPHLEQSVYADGLRAESVAELHQAARREWRRLLKRFAEHAMEREALDRDQPDALHRFRLGLYFHSDDAVQAPSVPAGEPRDASAPGGRTGAAPDPDR